MAVSSSSGSSSPPAGPLPVIAIRYSRRGEERVWCDTASRDASDGPAAVHALVGRFAKDAGHARSESVRLRTVPARPGGPQKEVSPVLGESVAAFLERTCREDNGAFQMRAEFGECSGAEFVHVRVAFPGTTTCVAVASGHDEPPPMMIEQFECLATSDVAALKRLIHARTQFPMNRALLLLGSMRLHDDMPMSRVTAASMAAAVPLQLHVVACGAYMFLRRLGQGHCEPSGPCTLTLCLPPCIQGAHVRPMPFDPKQKFSDFRLSVQAVCGLPPAHLRISITIPFVTSLVGVADNELLESLGFSDGCTVRVQLAEYSAAADPYDIHFDTPTTGSAATLYQRAAATLGIADDSRLALFAGDTAIDRDVDLARAPIADGAVLAAYISWSLQLHFSVLGQKGTTTTGGNRDTIDTNVASSSSSVSSPLPSSVPGAPTHACTVACLSSDNVGEVRERVVGMPTSAKGEGAGTLRGSKVFSVDRSVWLSNATECTTLGSLARLLGHFEPLSDRARLSRLGIADGSAHLVFVPEEQVLVEVDTYVNGEQLATRKLRVSINIRLAQLAKLLERSLEEDPPADCAGVERDHCQWAFATSAVQIASAEASEKEPMGMAATVAAAVAKRKRKSVGGRPGDSEGSEKQRKLNPCLTDELGGEEFVGDLQKRNPRRPAEVPSHFLCPISYEVMRDPVVVVGSGNTYNRDMIERHFQTNHTDPLTNIQLRRASDRRLVQNNTLRSQIDEMERSQVDLHLAAYLREKCRRESSSDASMSMYLGWFPSMLRGSM